MIRDAHPGSRIRILIFYPSRISGSKRHRDPESGSATLVFTSINYNDPVNYDISVNLNLGHTGIVCDQYRGRVGWVPFGPHES